MTPLHDITLMRCLPQECASCLYPLAYGKLVSLLSLVTSIRRTCRRLAGFLEAECCHLLGCFQEVFRFFSFKTDGRRDVLSFNKS